MIYRKALTSELSNTAGGAFTVLFSIVVTIGLVRILNQTAGGRYDTGSILEVVAYTSLVNLPALISLALFLAVLMTLNRYWRDSEMFVWFSAGGLSLASWIRPVLKFTIPIVFLVAACSIVISPWSRSQIQSYRDRFAQKEDVTKLSSGRFIEAKSGRQVFFLEQVDQERGNVETLLLVELKKDGSRSVLTSKKGHLETKPNGDRYVILQDGRKYETDPSGLGASVSDFGEYEVRLDSSPTSQVSSARVNAMPFKELLESKNRKAPAEIFWRLSWPLIALNLAILGIPLSYNNPRSLKYYGQTAAVLIFILYLNGLSIFQTWITQGKVGIYSSMLYMNVPVALLSAYLFYRLMTLNVGHFDARIWGFLTKPFRVAAAKRAEKKDKK